MSSIWGNNIKLSIFGESHSRAIGGVIDNLPPGIEIDMEEIKYELKRRQTGSSALATARKEPDMPEILSGVVNGRTTGTPLGFVIYNSDQHSKDYDNLKTTARPSHADYTGFLRYNGFNDHRGGGHFSGRLTAPLVFAGAIAKCALKQKGIYTVSRIKSIMDIEDTPWDLSAMTYDEAKKMKDMIIPTIDPVARERMEERVLGLKSELDSAGGIIECAIMNMEKGIGNPIFDAFESRLSSLIFSVPAVKGLEFGEGFNVTRMRGSEANDSLYTDGGRIYTKTNHDGGINGGITNGMPIVFRTAIKPTASISREQDSVNFVEMKNEKLTVVGRHDACICVRAVSVIDACATLCAFDYLVEAKMF
ncbi:MAG: chorismate synthase [Clostridia bacterium]|nr:chorismate synthase [Clostridia bacterium]